MTCLLVDENMPGIIEACPQEWVKFDQHKIVVVSILGCKFLCIYRVSLCYTSLKSITSFYALHRIWVVIFFMWILPSIPFLCVCNNPNLRCSNCLVPSIWMFNLSKNSTMVYLDNWTFNLSKNSTEYDTNFLCRSIKFVVKCELLGFCITKLWFTCSLCVWWKAYDPTSWCYSTDVGTAAKAEIKKLFYHPLRIA